MKFNSKALKRRLLWLVYLPVIIFRALVIGPLEAAKIRSLIKSLNSGRFLGNKTQGQVFLASSFRITSDERASIFETAFRQSLKSFKGHTRLAVADASDGPFSARVLSFLKSQKGVVLDYLNRSERLTGAYYNLLTQAKEKYFAMLFDDFPICNFNPEFLKASESLLNDFEGLVDLVFIEGVTEYKIDKSNQTIFYNLNSRDFKHHPSKLVGTVKYDEYEFAILENFHYGFFFNTVVANAKDYARRLKWYMDNIDYNSPHAIELAGSLKIGPVYKFIAVPLNVFNFDIDYSHTDISIREVVKGARELQNALDKGYELKPAQD